MFVLAYGPEEMMERYKVSGEYTRDLKASIEQYKSLSDYARALHSYAGKAMAPSIKLTKGGYRLSILLLTSQDLISFLHSVR